MTATTTDPTEPETTTEQTATTESAETPDADAGQETTEEGGKAARDAARYRTQLRTVEAERDQLVERVAALQRAQVEALAADKVKVPADVFDIGRVELADLLDEAGEVDADAVNAAVETLLGDRPGLSARPGLRPDPHQGRPSAGPGGASWADVIRGKN